MSMHRRRQVKGNAMSYVFTHATLLDGTRDMQPQENMTVAVDDNGRISAVRPLPRWVLPVRRKWT